MNQTTQFFADHALQQTVTIVEQEQLACDTWRLRVAAPEIARQVKAGQFVMLKLHGCDDPLLGRPLAVYDVVNDPRGMPYWLDLVYLVVGKLTSRLAVSQPGTKLDLWGPLGNGFSLQRAREVIMVAGGIGQTPFLLLGKEYLARGAQVTLLYGSRNKNYLAGLAAFTSAGMELRVSTDDGSQGHHGLVTDLLREELSRPVSATAPENQSAPRLIAVCGPEKMLEAVAHLAAEFQTPCEVSLETPMACGLGICFSCVTKVRQLDGSWDYRRTCVEGPIFDAEEIVWA